MKLKDIKGKIPEVIYDRYEEAGLDELRPAQSKAIDQGLFDSKSMIVCTPTGSGKTFVAELAIIDTILTKKKGKAIYLAPLKALASEKRKQFKQRYGELFSIALSIGDLDSGDPHLAKYDLIIATSEKLDSVIRHGAPWVKDISLVIIDEIHMLTDPRRGPTLEILITLLKRMLKDVQILGLSATIGNPKELSDWLGAELVIDTWRPCELKKGILLDGEVTFDKPPP
jgi:helicase